MTETVFQVAEAPMSAGVGDPVALESGPASFAGARWGGLEERRVGSGAGGDGHVMTKPGEHPGAVGRVGDEVDPPVGKPLGERIDQVTGQIGRASCRERV